MRGSRDEGCLSEGELEWQAADFFSREPRSASFKILRPILQRVANSSLAEPKMPRSLARLSASASSHRNLSSAVFITNIAESDFSVHTGVLGASLAWPNTRCDGGHMRTLQPPRRRGAALKFLDPLAQYANRIC